MENGLQIVILIGAICGVIIVISKIWRQSKQNQQTTRYDQSAPVSVRQVWFDRIASNAPVGTYTMINEAIKYFHWEPSDHRKKILYNILHYLEMGSTSTDVYVNAKTVNANALEDALTYIRKLIAEEP